MENLRSGFLITRREMKDMEFSLKGYSSGSGHIYESGNLGLIVHDREDGMFKIKHVYRVPQEVTI